MVHSRDDKGTGVAHKVNLPKNQPQFSYNYSDGAVLVMQK